MSHESATEKWKRLLAEQTAKGKPRSEAVRVLAQRYPALHLAMLGEVNADRPSVVQSLSAAAVAASEPPPAEPAAREFGDPIGEWARELVKLEAQGMLRAKAISKLAKEQPDLHAAYIEAYNLVHADARH